jgi:hypothetical protein
VQCIRDLGSPQIVFSNFRMTNAEFDFCYSISFLSSAAGRVCARLRAEREFCGKRPVAHEIRVTRGRRIGGELCSFIDRHASSRANVSNAKKSHNTACFFRVFAPLDYPSSATAATTSARVRARLFPIAAHAAAALSVVMRSPTPRSPSDAARRRADSTRTARNSQFDRSSSHCEFLVRDGQRDRAIVEVQVCKRRIRSIRSLFDPAPVFD